MKYVPIFLVLIIHSLILTTSVTAQEQEIPSADSFLQNHGLSVGSELPAFNYQSIDGEHINLDDYEGQYILIDFWGTWCKPCVKEAPFLSKAHRKFGGQVKFIGVAVDDKEEKVREFIEKYDTDWTQVMTASDSDLIQKFNVKLFPTTFLVGPNQKILVGANSEEAIASLKGEELINTLNEYVNQ